MDTCCRETWDQRISNEPIYERNFLYAQPPILLQDRPRSTTWCNPRQRQEWLHTTPAIEQAAANYWSSLNTCGRGVLTSSSAPNAQPSLELLARQYPSRPWLSGVQRHIDGESTLMRLNYYNPRDCVADEVQGQLDKYNSEADAKFVERMRADAPMHLKPWNNSTSAKLLTPI